MKQVVAVGVSSLHPDEHQDGGEGVSRHVFFCDLDSPRPGLEPEAFRRVLQGAMHEFGIRVCYVFRTLKGFHVVSCDLGSRRETERFEERLRDFGTDSLHGAASYWNGHAVLRVSKKPGEANGPTFLRAVLARSPRAEAFARPWSGAHYAFLNELHNHRLPAPGPILHRAKASGGVHLERYTTKAVAPAVHLERYTTKAVAPAEAAPLVAVQEPRAKMNVAPKQVVASVGIGLGKERPEPIVAGDLIYRPPSKSEAGGDA